MLRKKSRITILNSIFHLQRELEIDCFTKVQKDKENGVFDSRSESQIHSIFQKFLFLLGLLLRRPNTVVINNQKVWLLHLNISNKEK